MGTETWRELVKQFGCVSIGLAIGIAIAAQNAHASRPLDTSQPCSEGKVNQSTLHGKTARDLLSGVIVMAEHLYFHKGGNPELTAKRVFAVVHVVMHNYGHKPFSYNALDFRLHGSNDFIDYFSGDTDLLAGPALSAGSILPGDSIAGDVSFAIPAAEQGYSLHWYPNLAQPYIAVPINQ